MGHTSRLAKFLGCLALALSLLPAELPSQSLPPTPPGFVTRSGTSFVLEGKVFPVAGVNNHYLTFGSEQEVVRVLDDAVAMGANVVRTFLQPVIGSLDGVTVPTVWNWRRRAEASDLGVNGAYMIYWDPQTGGMAINDGPSGLQRFDFLVAEARKRNLKLLVALLDFWAYTGGAQQMQAWYGSADKHSSFAKDPRSIRNYKTWAAHVIGRQNTITGMRYADDPTIFAWELMNEPVIQPATLLREWITEMSGFIKSVDPHHLVATGHGNLYDSFSDLEIATIDFGTWHGYPIHWRITPLAMNEKIGDFCAIARRYQKPMLLEEFGLARSNPDQADVYRMWLNTIHDNHNCAGWVIWRLVSRQDSGRYPIDRHDQFDIRNDGRQTWQVLQSSAVRLRGRS